MNANDTPALPDLPSQNNGNEMTLDEFVAWCEENQTQDENGVDLSHLRENLRLTPAERLEKHELARRAVLELQRGKRRHNPAHGR